MTVTQVEALFGSKSKYRVYLDGQPAFVLYRGELSRYHIREGWELAEKDYGDIREMLTKRARLRAMKLLPRGGYLATCSCSHFMTEELFCKMLRAAAFDAKVALRQIEARQQSPDHPILWNVPETNYLKFYLFQVV